MAFNILLKSSNKFVFNDGHNDMGNFQYSIEIIACWVPGQWRGSGGWTFNILLKSSCRHPELQPYLRVPELHTFNILLKSSHLIKREERGIDRVSSFNILLKSSNVTSVETIRYTTWLSIFFWNHLLGWFLFGVLKFFLFVSWFSWEHVSASNAYGSCLFPRYFNFHGNDLFPR